MLHRLFAALVVVLGLLTATGASATPGGGSPTAEQQAEIRRLQALLDSVQPQTGLITIGSAKTTLNLGEEFYFLGAEDARRVLTEAWGNPPSAADGVLGMVFPAGKDFLDDTWGAVITYTADGYVSDEDAAGIDYDRLLTEMRSGEEAENRARAADGYEPIVLTGWAQQPSYDAQRHNLIWAKELAFGNDPQHTLNYDVRVLGKSGVLSMNIVAGMDDLQTVGPDAARLMNTVTFNPGFRYADYREGVDPKAAYGVAGLIAGGAALAVAKKVGILGILLLVLKKGGVFILIGIGAAFTWLRNLFAGKKGGNFSTPAGELNRPRVDAEPDPGLGPIPKDDTTQDDQDKPR